MLVATALGAYGASSYFGGYPNPPQQALPCYRAGFALMAICWVVLALLVVYALRSIRILQGKGGEVKVRRTPRRTELWVLQC